MTKETVLVIGLGEIGRTIFELLKENEDKFTVYGLDLDPAKMSALGLTDSKLPKRVDTIHVCLPCSNRDVFTNATINYAKQFKPKLIIINSTVPPGTTMEVFSQSKCHVAHSPSRGVHRSPEYMKWEMKRWTKYVGGADRKSAIATSKHFEKMNLKVKTLKSCKETELAKLFETTYRAWMVACFQEMHRISRKFGADFDETVDFLEDTHRIRFDRPIMFQGPKGGHCLIPNTELLLGVHASDFLCLILSSNQKRKEEMKDKQIAAEVEKVKKRAEAVQEELMKSGTPPPESC